jgi:hypothetical protein
MVERDMTRRRTLAITSPSDTISICPSKAIGCCFMRAKTEDKRVLSCGPSTKTPEPQRSRWFYW